MRKWLVAGTNKFVVSAQRQVLRRISPCSICDLGNIRVAFYPPE